MNVDRALNIVRSPAGSYRYPALREAWETLADEVERLHTWDGLMSLLDEHYSPDVFQADAHDGAADPRPRIIALTREVSLLRELLKSLLAPND